jgi:hypothetical protein
MQQGPEILIFDKTLFIEIPQKIKENSSRQIFI